MLNEERWKLIDPYAVYLKSTETHQLVQAQSQQSDAMTTSS